MAGREVAKVYTSSWQFAVDLISALPFIYRVSYWSCPPSPGQQSCHEQLRVGCVAIVRMQLCKKATGAFRSPAVAFLVCVLFWGC